MSSLQDTPRGLLRVTTGINVAFLGPILSDFLKRYPEVRLEVLATGRAAESTLADLLSQIVGRL